MIGFVILVLLAIVFIWVNTQYQKQNYYKITGNSLLSVWFDTGKLGEYMIYRYLRNYEKSGAKFLFNVYIPKSDGTTSEIDLLMITDRGIFVFESKNYSGWIFGNEKSQYWYQTLPAGRGKSHKEKFYNPILQNESHIKYLRTFLAGESPIESIIVFSERCTLKQVDYSAERVTVTKRENIESVVYSLYAKATPDILTHMQIDMIYQKLYPCTQVDTAVKLRHIETIQGKMETAPVTESVASQEPICPRCGGKLILRKAKRGANAGNQFYGCSNYPKCRYVRDITDSTVHEA